MGILIVVLIILVSILVLIYLKHAKQFSGLANVPGISGEILFTGATLKLLNKSTVETFEIIAELFNSSNSTFKTRMGPYSLIGISNPSEAVRCLGSNQCLEKGFVYRLCPNTRGLLTASVKYWKNHRKNLNSIFNTSLVHSFVPSFSTNSDYLVKRLTKYCGTNMTVDIMKYSTYATQQMVSTNHFNYDGIVPDEISEYFYDTSAKIKELIQLRSITFWMHSNFLHRFTENYRQCEEFLESVRKVIREHFVEPQLVALTRVLKTNPNTRETEKQQNFIKRITYLLNQKIFDYKDVTDECENINFTTSESSAAITSTCLLMLAMHPDIQQMCYEEICGVFANDDVGSNGYQITLDQLNQLNYIEMVLKETMRLFPLAPYLLRQSLDTLDMGHYSIPKGCHVLVSVWKMHRDPTFWGNNSNLFDPDHFLPENYSKVPQGAYMPFSSGPRNCPGLKYAFLVMKTMVVKLLSNYQFNTHIKLQDIRPSLDITMTIVKPHYLTINKRIK